MQEENKIVDNMVDPESIIPREELVQEIGEDAVEKIEEEAEDVDLDIPASLE